MAQHRVPWTEERLAILVRELGRGPTVAEAGRRLAIRWGINPKDPSKWLDKVVPRHFPGKHAVDFLPSALKPGVSIPAMRSDTERAPAPVDFMGPDFGGCGECQAQRNNQDHKDHVHVGANEALGSPFGRVVIGAMPERPAPKKPEPPKDPVAARQEKKGISHFKREHDNLVELLRAEREKSAFLAELSSHRAPPKIIRREKTSGLREATALVLASDWHVEETVDAVKVQGKNEYNLTIAGERIDRFFKGAIDLVEHHRASGRIVIRDMILALMGDLITGFIHEELQQTNALSPIETILWLTPKLRNGIYTLVETLGLDSLTIPCDPGNHGRTTKKRPIATGCEMSYEWGMYCQLAREFAGDPRIHFDTTPANDHYVQVYDFTLHTTHGDSVNYWGGVGGLTIPLNKAISAWNTDVRADWHAIGHFHQFIDIGAGIVNGSMIGWNPFAKWIKAHHNPRDTSQHFSLIDSKRGRCHTTNIWVAKALPQRAA